MHEEGRKRRLQYNHGYLPIDTNNWAMDELDDLCNFGWARPMLTWMVEIDRVVIRNAWSLWAGRPRIGNGAMHLNRCRNEEVNGDIVARTDGRSAESPTPILHYLLLHY
ncbi:hypothetical protein DPMN_142067 [Dreissena polymorpha]|uniref:Uncharacterized protein n=1 Tax=Dreissena polymorpha TaxID=45954 RepID=A0A9D4JLV0_DREPO|nr:hypothetical protein DPMN_142067 [Dreissena polymorpha]